MLLFWVTPSVTLFLGCKYIYLPKPLQLVLAAAVQTWAQAKADPDLALQSNLLQNEMREAQAKDEPL